MIIIINVEIYMSKNCNIKTVNLYEKYFKKAPLNLFIVINGG